jgi:hypothetical protein
MSILTMEKAAPSLSGVFLRGVAERIGSSEGVGVPASRRRRRSEERLARARQGEQRTDDGEDELAHGQKLLRHDLAVLALDERQLRLRGREHRHVGGRVKGGANVRNQKLDVRFSQRGGLFFGVGERAREERDRRVALEERDSPDSAAQRGEGSA